MGELGTRELLEEQLYDSSVALSNSAVQRRHIEAERDKRGAKNLEVVTCNVAEFQTERRFDRVISVEMFEHMKNYELLLERTLRLSGQVPPPPVTTGVLSPVGSDDGRGS